MEADLTKAGKSLVFPNEDVSINQQTSQSGELNIAVDDSINFDSHSNGNVYLTVFSFCQLSRFIPVISIL